VKPFQYRGLFERLLYNSVAIDGGYITECWCWIGSLNPVNKYPRLSLRVNGKHTKQLAHRVAYEEFKGVAIPPGYDVDHKCVNAWCIAPDHLQAVPLQHNRGYYRVERRADRPQLEGVT
jgi:hypothetical protein